MQIRPHPGLVAKYHVLKYFFTCLELKGNKRAYMRHNEENGINYLSH